MVTAAFGLVAALAWNEAIKALFTCQQIPNSNQLSCGPLAGAAAYGPWVYAIFVTIIAIIVAIWIGRIAKRATVMAEKTTRKAKTG